MLITSSGLQIGPLHNMAEGQEAVNFHQSARKKPIIQPLDPSH
jgi:hypothetical protein